MVCITLYFIFHCCIIIKLISCVGFFQIVNMILGVKMKTELKCFKNNSDPHFYVLWSTPSFLFSVPVHFSLPPWTSNEPKFWKLADNSHFGINKNVKMNVLATPFTENKCYIRSCLIILFLGLFPILKISFYSSKFTFQVAKLLFFEIVLA